MTGRRDEFSPQEPGSVDILIVDDTRGNLLALQAALSDLGGDIVCATSGTEALRALLDRDFGIIILDFQLPDMNGLETARMIRARERSKDIPIIFLTGYSYDQLDATNTNEFGAVDFLLKPVQPDVLRAKVAARLTRRVERPT